MSRQNDYEPYDKFLDLRQETRVESRRHETIQCDLCGSTDVYAVCHHCGKFLCARHVARPHFYERPSWEFKGMMRLSQWPKAAHCKEDAHFVFSYQRMVLIPALMGFIIVVFPFLAELVKLLRFARELVYEPVPHTIWASWLVLAWNQGQQGMILDMVYRIVRPIMALSGLVAGFLTAALAGYALYINKERPLLENHPKHTPFSDIPFAPSRYDVEATETLNLQAFVSTTAEQHINVQSAQGKVTAQAELDHRVQDSLKAYKLRAKKYGWPLQSKVGWDLGFMAMDVQSGVTWTPCLPRQGRAGNLFRLRQPYEEIPVEIEEGEEQWVKLVEQDYFLEEESLSSGAGDRRRAVLHVIPVLRPLKAGRTLVFLFSLPESLSGMGWMLRNMKLHLSSAAFAERDVDFPVEETNGVMDLSNWQVKWSRWGLDGLRTDSYPYEMLREPVPQLRSTLKLEFELEGDGLISGMNKVANRLWLPTGVPVERQLILQHRKTRINGEAYLDPLFFSYQKEYAVSESVHLPVAITPPRLRQFLNRFTAESPIVVVHTVSQNVPLVAMHQGCSSVGWDVFGRYYAHIYPIDVHLFLSSRCTLGGKELDSQIALTCRALINNQAEDVKHQVDWLAGRLVESIHEFSDSIRSANQDR
jgi:hypothetical protein